MKSWVGTYYPGTKTAITEYNWGDEGAMNGATTQADIFGIFGREGLDMANRWTTPASTSPVYNAIKIYRNYDGKKSTFGDTSVSDTALDADNVSSFAAVRTTDGALTIVVINKELTGTVPLTLNIANFAGQATAQVYQLTSANVITKLAGATISKGQITATLPAQSVTLYVIPPGSAL